MIEERCEVCPKRLDCVADQRECDIISLFDEASPRPRSKNQRDVRIRTKVEEIDIFAEVHHTHDDVSLTIVLSRKAFEVIATMLGGPVVIRGVSPEGFHLSVNHISVQTKEER